ncbi:hypothetical protein [Nostoc sp. NZL]|uniref:hypothetical protein n=1 Tax=Nostoc sp. NZL TaxID=2650612 RepID=UPI0018C457B1|nr:hypothetical protein [Nostoc sp. NZL]MBG1241764.1 hypothetical protein [Nostoc sp. NZL]
MKSKDLEISRRGTEAQSCVLVARREILCFDCDYIASLKKEIESLLNQYKELEPKIRATNPKYAGLKYPDPLKLTQIQQQLDSDTLLLQYSLGKEHSYLWVVTPNFLDTYELPGQEKIENAINDFVNRY